MHTGQVNSAPFLQSVLSVVLWSDNLWSFLQGTLSEYFLNNQFSFFFVFDDKLEFFTHWTVLWRQFQEESV